VLSDKEKETLERMKKDLETTMERERSSKVKRFPKDKTEFPIGLDDAG